MNIMPADFTFGFSDLNVDNIEPMNIKITPKNNRAVPIEINLFRTIFLSEDIFFFHILQ